MTRSQPGFISKWFLLSIALAMVLVGFGVYHFYSQTPSSEVGLADGEDGKADAIPDEIRVDVIRPTLGEMDRVTVQIGTVQSFEVVDLYSRVPGFLAKQTVDIGAHVKKGEVLAVVDVPELQSDVERRAAGVEQAEARVVQMESRVTSARADLKAVQATVVQAEATYRSAGATLRLRESQYGRMKKLFATESIAEKLVDEKHEARDAAAEAESAAKAAIETTKAQVSAAEAKILKVEADVVEAKAEVRVAEAELARANAMLAFATIRAPFDGVVSLRNYFVKDFIRSADTGVSKPLLRVERTDKMRVVVQIPDRDTPYANVGDPATVEIDALQGKKFTGTISRIAASEDPQTRLMRVEVDLPNPKGILIQGQFGRTTILLDHIKTPSIPSSCLVGKTKDRKGFVYVVRDGLVHLTPVDLGQDNGVRVGILHGLTGKERVVRRPPSNLSDGAAVVVSDPMAAKRAAQ